MRRFLFVVLALVLSLKAVAAGVVPIVGAPEHAHIAHAQVAVHAPMGHAHGDCAALADEVPTAADTLHEHACPHLGMALISPAPATFEAERSVPRAPTNFVAHFVSVVLDVPSPPPTRRA